jgi:hypothetical protein
MRILSLLTTLLVGTIAVADEPSRREIITRLDAIRGEVPDVIFDTADLPAFRGPVDGHELYVLLVDGRPQADEPMLHDTVGAQPPAGGIVLFGGKDLSGWVQKDGKTPAVWPVADGAMTVGRGDIRTEKTFGSFRLHVEFNVPSMPEAKGQARGNSGVYLQGRHELQVLDSYGLESQDNDCGAIYKQVAPTVNACKPPLQWQSYDVTFHSAQVADGRTARKARVTVVQNGVTIIDDKEIAPTPGGVDMKEGQDGPILLQDHGNAVRYRNIWVVPLEVAQD